MLLTPPPKKDPADYEAVPDGVYEVAVEDVEEVLQNERFWKDPAVPQYQLKWSLVVVDEGEYNGKRITMWTGNAIGRHPRNKLTGLLKVIVPDFDLDDESTYFKDEDEFKARTKYRQFRVVTKQSSTTKVVEGEEKTYVNAKVESFLKSAKPVVSQNDVEAALAAAGLNATAVDETQGGTRP